MEISASTEFLWWTTRANIEYFRAKNDPICSPKWQRLRSSLKGNVPHLAWCGSEDSRGLYSIKLRIFGFHFRGATRCKQRAVHCLSMTTWVVTRNVKTNFFRSENFNIFYDLKPEKFPKSPLRAPTKPEKNRTWPEKIFISEIKFFSC